MLFTFTVMKYTGRLFLLLLTLIWLTALFTSCNRKTSPPVLIGHTTTIDSLYEVIRQTEQHQIQDSLKHAGELRELSDHFLSFLNKRQEKVNTLFVPVTKTIYKQSKGGITSEFKIYKDSLGHAYYSLEAKLDTTLEDLDEYKQLTLRLRDSLLYERTRDICPEGWSDFGHSCREIFAWIGAILVVVSVGYVVLRVKP